MSTPRDPAPAKLVVGVILHEKVLMEPVVCALEGRFGPVDAVSRWLAFDFTSYYAREMGTHLVRRMVSFKRPVRQDALPGIKHFTNELEKRYLSDKRRRVNIDPGYLLLERFVLATGKNFTHRIYIGDGIYADLTLTYASGGFQPLPWTYPDYAGADIQGFLIGARNKYKIDLSMDN